MKISKNTYDFWLHSEPEQQQQQRAYRVREPIESVHTEESDGSYNGYDSYLEYLEDNHSVDDAVVDFGYSLPANYV